MVVRTPVTSPIFKKQFANLNLNVNPLSDADLKSAGAFASPISNYIPSKLKVHYMIVYLQFQSVGYGNKSHSKQFGSHHLKHSFGVIHIEPI